MRRSKNKRGQSEGTNAINGAKVRAQNVIKTYTKYMRRLNTHTFFAPPVNTELFWVHYFATKIKIAIYTY